VDVCKKVSYFQSGKYVFESIYFGMLIALLFSINYLTLKRKGLKMKIQDIIKAILLSVLMTGIIYFFDEKNMIGIVATAILSIILIINMTMGLLKDFKKDNSDFKQNQIL
jgi:hypothetical protein